MLSPIPSHLSSAYRQCQAQAFRHYENFPVASLLLPKESRPHVAALYVFARVADDFADEPPDLSFLRGKKGNEKKIQQWRLGKIDQWEKSLRSALKGKDAPPALQAFAHTLNAFQIPINLPLDLLKAFRMDVTVHRYADWNSLLNYCRHSANPVGRMVLLISGVRDEALHRYSDFICSGLQLINFWQDSSLDLSRGRIYYPRSEWKKAGVPEKDLLARKWSPAARKLVENAINATQAHFQKGLPLLSAVRGRLGWELKATYGGGLGILNKIRAMDYNVLENRPALSAWDKAALALRTLFMPFRT